MSARQAWWSGIGLMWLGYGWALFAWASPEDRHEVLTFAGKMLVAVLEAMNQ